MSLKEIINKTWKVGKKLLIVTAVGLSINAVSIPITYNINKNLTAPKSKTVVFTSGYQYVGDYILSPESFLTSIVARYIDFFMYTPTTLRQNLKNNQVDWYSNSTKVTVLEKLLDDQYKNIVFIGHGTNSSYVATDGMVKVSDIRGLDLKKRDGEFIQHTCGHGKGESLRDVLFNQPSQGYSFNRKISGLENYITALIKLFEK